MIFLLLFSVLNNQELYITPVSLFLCSLWLWASIGTSPQSLLLAACSAVIPWCLLEPSWWGIKCRGWTWPVLLQLHLSLSVGLSGLWPSQVFPQWSSLSPTSSGEMESPEGLEVEECPSCAGMRLCESLFPWRGNLHCGEFSEVFYNDYSAYATARAVRGSFSDPNCNNLVAKPTKVRGSYQTVAPKFLTLTLLHPASGSFSSLPFKCSNQLMAPQASTPGEQISMVTLDSPVSPELNALMGLRKATNFQFVQPFLLRRGVTTSKLLPCQNWKRKCVWV